MFDIPAHLLWTLVTPDQVWGFALTTCRVFGCLQFAPITSEPAIPFRVRLMLAVVIGWLVASITPFSIASVAYPLPLVAVLELALGAAMGLGATLILMGLRGAADLIDQQSGLAMARILDPQLNEESTPHAPLLWLAGIAAFVLLAPIGGDLLLVGHLLETFQVVPIGFAGPETMTDMLLSSLLGACRLAIGVAAPLLVLLSLMNWGLALWQRAEPSMNHAGWLLPVRIAALWLMLGWSAGMLPQSIDHAFGESSASLHDAVQPAREE
jgi:flagellar biosynthesis protein FliR